MKNDLGLTVLTIDQIHDLSLSIPALPEKRLLATWAYIQDIKYNAMYEVGDCEQPNLIFHSCELPLIKRMYPSEVVYPKVKTLISTLLKRAKQYQGEKLGRYKDIRKSGVPLERARAVIAPIMPEDLIAKQVSLYSRPFSYQYKISCRDADLLYSLGIDDFIKLFYDRFYVPKEFSTGRDN